jgi:carboxyl-terminal processing protease
MHRPTHLRLAWPVAIALITGARPAASIAGELPVAADTAASSTEYAKNRQRAAQRFLEVYEDLQFGAVPAPDNEALLDAALRGMVRDADPDGSDAYFTAEELREFTEGLAGGAGGTGLVCMPRAGEWTVVNVTRGSAAEEAGIRSGDLIERIDGRVLTAPDAWRLIRRLSGPAGTQVAVSTRHPGEPTARELALERRARPAVAPSLVEVAPSIALLRIDSFQLDTLDRVVALLTPAPSAGVRWRGLVIDLRDQPGGLLDTTVAIASIFLPADAVVVRTAGRRRESTATYTGDLSPWPRLRGAAAVPRLRDAWRDVPLAVLVNGQTASGAEIVAGALQDHHRAALVGTPTFGKANIQTVLPLKGGGAIKVTTAWYETPQGRRLQGQGLQPDVRVDDPAPEAAVRAAIARLQAR